jgi:hypothetical protein
VTKNFLRPKLKNSLKRQKLGNGSLPKAIGNHLPFNSNSFKLLLQQISLTFKASN